MLSAVLCVFVCVLCRRLKVTRLCQTKATKYAHIQHTNAILCIFCYCNTKHKYNKSIKRYRCDASQRKCLERINHSSFSLSLYLTHSPLFFFCVCFSTSTISGWSLVSRDWQAADSIFFPLDALFSIKLLLYIKKNPSCAESVPPAIWLAMAAECAIYADIADIIRIFRDEKCLVVRQRAHKKNTLHVPFIKLYCCAVYVHVYFFIQRWFIFLLNANR